MTRLPLLICLCCGVFCGFVFGVGRSETAVVLSGSTDGYPMRITDATGVTMRIEDAPRRVASATLMTDEILVGLGVRDSLVSVTPLADDPGISNITEKTATIPHRSTLNAEVLLDLRPDLVFVASWSNADVVRQLRDAGLVLIALPSPRTLEGIRQTILTIAVIVDRQDEGDRLLGSMDSVIEDVQARVGDIPTESRLTVVDFSPTGTAFGTGSSWDEIVRLAGLTNAAASLPSDRWGNVALSQEQLLELDPDVVVLPGWSWDDPEGSDAFRAEFVTDPAFRALQAVRDDRVYLADERHRLSTSHHVVEAVRDLAQFAYPERFD